MRNIKFVVYAATFFAVTYDPKLGREGHAHFAEKTATTTVVFKVNPPPSTI